jgi:hypothetical protein
MRQNEKIDFAIVQTFLENIFASIWLVSGLEIRPLFDGLARSGSKIAHTRPPRPLLYQSPARLARPELALIISIFLYKKDFHTIELHHHFGNLQEHSKKFITIVVMSSISLNNYNACKNNIKDKPNHLLNRKSKMCSLTVQLHEDYHSLTRISQE